MSRKISPSIHFTVNKKSTRSKTTPQAPLSTGKRWLFRLLMLGVPILFFLLLEGGLRLFGYGDVYPLFIPLEDGSAYKYQNAQVGRRYFAGQRRIPNANVDFFKAEKRPEGFRVFVQGGSSAAGYPFYHGGMFSRMLEQRLQQTFPERDIEVVNTAMSAVNSYTLLDFSDEILAEAPDVVLIYAGHNEYYGALGVASAESFGRMQPLVLLYLKLRNLRTMQALRNGLAWVRSQTHEEATPASDGTLMERIVGEQTIPMGSPLYEIGLAQYRRNMDALLGKYAEAGIPVLIGTLASNERDHAPFDGGIEGEPASAAAHFAEGRRLEALGQFEAARKAYLQAKDRDALRFRAPEAMNQVIRELAEKHGAVVVETQQALSEASPGGIIGRNVMLEHLHPSLEGYFLMADAFYAALQAEGMIGNWTRPVSTARARTERLHTVVDSLVGHYRVQRLMGGWPFQPLGTRNTYVPKARTPVEQIAVALYERKVGWPETMNALRHQYAAEGNGQEALRTSFAFLQEYPFFPEAYLAAGDVLVEQARFDEAIVYYQAANDLEESAQAQRMIGALMLRRKEVEEAIPYLERAVALNPKDETSLYNLGGAYVLNGQSEPARETLTQLLILVPNHADAQRLMASL